MDEETKLKYLPQEKRDEILKKRYEEYQNQIISFEISSAIIQRALDLSDSNPNDKKLKIGKVEYQRVKDRLEENKKGIEASYAALRIIADKIIGEFN